MARKGFSTCNYASLYATRHASNTRERAPDVLVVVPVTSQLCIAAINLACPKSLSRYYFVPTGTCIPLSLSLSLPLLFLSIFLSPVEGEFLIGIDILVARAVIIEMRNGRNFPACLLLNHTDEACLPIFGQTRLAILASRNVHKRRFFLLFMFKVF